MGILTRKSRMAGAMTPLAVGMERRRGRADPRETETEDDDPLAPARGTMWGSCFAPHSGC